MDRDKSIIAQNAGSTAAALYNALVANRGDTSFGAEEYDSIRLAVFNGTLELAGAETVVTHFEATSASAGADEIRTSASTSRPNENVEIKMGKHKGKTIGQVFDSGTEGADYIEWMADKVNNPFLKEKAQEFLAAVAA